jgi:hypothetical protein
MCAGGGQLTRIFDSGVPSELRGKSIGRMRPPTTENVETRPKPVHFSSESKFAARDVAAELTDTADVSCGRNQTVLVGADNLLKEPLNQEIVSCDFDQVPP